MRNVYVWFALLLIGMASPALAGSHYDWHSGNSYYTTPGAGGGATVRGYNSNTGSQWNTTIHPNGNMRGVDSGGNYWNYNSGSGAYMNFGTGRVCVGHGAARVCN